ncbi:MAG: 4Fe-4S binding protein, partial [Actinobacteria bacterium]|nr:4Fe-4S binding protein [Actinomycetota bacterium]
SGASMRRRSGRRRERRREMETRADQVGEALRRAMSIGGDEAIQELVRAWLRDRDYENLSTGERLAAHARTTGESRRVVCDCVDIEPGVRIARLLLDSQADAVVEGAYLAAFATGSQRTVFHVAESDTEAAGTVVAATRALRQAVSEVDGIDLQIVRGPFRRNMKGYEDVPTVVLTAETLLNVSRVLAGGAEAYRRTGVPQSPGAKLFQVLGEVRRPGIAELPLGITLREAIEQVGGGVADGQTALAIMVGGARGVCYRPDELDQPLDFDQVKQAGGAIGSGAIIVLGDKDCVVDRVRRCMEVSCYDLCGTCALGREGSYQLREVVADATNGRSKGTDVELIREIGRAMRAGAACAFGRTAPNLLLSALEKFPEEYEAHMKRRLCRALVCRQYVTFHILPDRCDGCGACVDVCPEEAIEGGRGKIHVVDQDACDRCGKCLDVCSGRCQAVVRTGAIKPHTPKRPIPVGSWKQ